MQHSEMNKINLNSQELVKLFLNVIYLFISVITDIKCGCGRREEKMCVGGGRCVRVINTFFYKRNQAQSMFFRHSL